jgi:hypothetical protein
MSRPGLLSLPLLLVGACTQLYSLDGYDNGYANVVRADRPLAYWRLGEKTGAVARDDRGAHDGTYQMVALGEPGALHGNANTAAGFTLEASAVIVDTELDPTVGGAFTIEAWASPAPEVTTGLHRIMTKRVDDTVPHGWSLANDPVANRLTFEMYDDGTGAYHGVGTSMQLAPDGYHHVVVTYDGGSLLIYFDGEQVGQRTGAIHPMATTAQLVLGSLSSADANAWAGDLDEIAVYDRALDAAAIGVHFHAGAR